MENVFADFTERLLDYIRRAVTPSGRDSTEGRFKGLALELFALQYQHNPAYQRICRARKVSPEMVTSWKAVPFIPTEAFKELELTSIPEGARSTVFHSSGTTGQKPSRHFHCAESLLIYEAALLPWFREQLLRAHLPARQAEPKYLFLTPPQAAAPHSSLVHMFETIRRSASIEGSLFAGRAEPDGSWHIDVELAFRFLTAAIARDEAVGVLGTAFNFVHFLDELSRRGEKLRLPGGSYVMETGGYKGRSRAMPRNELHGWISQMLGIQGSDILCEYGMSELSSQAYDRMESSAVESAAKRIFQFPPWARVQIISPESGRQVREGETGLIRVFDLANVYSVAAVQTEDLAISRGNGFELAGRSEGAEARGCSLQSY